MDIRVIVTFLYFLPIISRRVTRATTSAPTLCPGTIPHGSIISYCDRSLFSFCHYTCDSGCEKEYSQLYCAYDGDWSPKWSACKCEDRRVTPAITTKRPFRCPSTIPNGNIYHNCNRLPHSRCGFSCDSGCESILIKLICSWNGYWVKEASACSCQGFGSTAVPEYGDTTNTERIVGITLGVIGMFVLVTGCVVFCCYRIQQQSSSQPVRHQDSTLTWTVPNRRTPSAPPNYMLPNQENFGTSLQQPTNMEQSPFMQLQPPSDASIHIHEPTEYTGMNKPEPSDDPPSYDQVISHPSEFKA